MSPNLPYLGIEWDAENRLLAINQGTLRSEFTYDGESRRVRIVEKSGQTITSDRRFLWCMRAICEERNSSGGTVVKRYFVDGVQQSAQAFFYSRDHLGSIRELSDGVAAIKARYDYDLYGKRNVVSEDQVADFGFTGHYEHAPSGTTLTLFRAYVPSIGRWLSEDPAGLADGPNLYAYVRNNPVNDTDPSGLCADRKSCGIKTPPEYNLSGTVSGGTTFTWKASFLNDSTHDPACCEVRQLISWNREAGRPPGTPPHPGFPDTFEPGGWYEDRDQFNKRYGRRTGPYADPQQGWDEYSGNTYSGADMPTGFQPGARLRFRLIVVDVCNGGRTIYTSRTLTVAF